MIEHTSRTEQFQRTLSRLLRPIARAMIAHGVTLNAATDVLKRALFDAAADMASQESKMTDSRISLLTGLHRKDVRRLGAETEPVARRSLMNACSLAISYWTATAKYRDSKGKPRRLPRAGKSGTPGFDDLVRDARIDLPASTVLNALVVQDAVAVDSDRDTVTLMRDVFLGSPDSEAMISAYEKNLLAHLQAATENLLSSDDQVRNFERAAHFSHLSDASIAKLVKESARLSNELLAELNRQAIALQQEDASNSRASGRFSVGAYVLGKTGPSENGEEEK